MATDPSPAAVPTTAAVPPLGAGGAAVTVIGIDGGPLPVAAGAAIAAAKLLVGGARHLAAIGPEAAPEAERIVLGDVAAAVARLAAHNGAAVVLASGDPGFFGIVRALRRAGLDPRVLPGVSSVTQAFARLGEPWDDAVVVSAHGRALRRAVNVCRAHRRVAVLTGPGAGPRELAAALAGVPRRIVVASRLGTPDERISGPQDATEPNVTLVLGETDHCAAARWIAGADPTPAGTANAGWALPESAFEHRASMITKFEVRALVLAKLGPRRGDLVWDVGSGSGSVSVECVRLGAAAIAVERDPAGCATIAGNAARHDVDVQVIEGTAPGALHDLPDPDAVFVGGGGPAVLAACLRRRPPRVVAAFAALERVGPALAALAQAGYTAEGTQLQANRLTPLPDGTHRLAPTNPVHVIWGEINP
jgi:precorrin-6Y C5,15-methyltransferase (decarboxylating)